MVVTGGGGRRWRCGEFGFGWEVAASGFCGHGDRREEEAEKDRAWGRIGAGMLGLSPINVLFVLCGGGTGRGGDAPV